MVGGPDALRRVFNSHKVSRLSSQIGSASIKDATFPAVAIFFLELVPGGLNEPPYAPPSEGDYLRHHCMLLKMKTPVNVRQCFKYTTSNEIKKKVQ